MAQTWPRNRVLTHQTHRKPRHHLVSRWDPIWVVLGHPLGTPPGTPREHGVFRGSHVLGGLIPKKILFKMIFDEFIIHPQMSKYHIIYQPSKVKPEKVFTIKPAIASSVSSNSNNIICLENKFTKKNMSNHFGLIFFWFFKTKAFCWVGSPWTPLFFGAYGEILSESTKLSGSRSPRGFLLLQTLESLQWGYPASRHGFNGLTKTSKNGGLVGRWMEDVEVSTLKQRGWFGPLIFRFHVSFLGQ